MDFLFNTDVCSYYVRLRGGSFQSSAIRQAAYLLRPAAL